MKKLLTSWLLTSLALPINARTAENGRLTIEVHIYNYSSVSAVALARAEKETARIYQRLGVAMEWRNCPRTAEELAQSAACDFPAASTRFTLRLLSDEMAHTFPLSGEIYGFALLPVHNGYGVVADVFADRARKITTDEQSHGVILGHLIAHELGHLLLGEAGHPAAAGIMHVPWQTKELEQIKRGVMLFLPGQTERIRAQIVARTTVSSSELADSAYGRWKHCGTRWSPSRSRRVRPT